MRFTRFLQIGKHLPRAGIITVYCPTGYDKTGFVRVLQNETWVLNGHHAYVSVATLDRTPMALLRAMVNVLPLSASHRLPALLARNEDQEDVLPELITAAKEHLQDPALTGHLLILDDLDEMTDEMTAMLAGILLRTLGRITPRVVLAGRLPKMGLRAAGVALTHITEEHLALSAAELAEMGVTDPALLGWPLAARHALKSGGQVSAEALHALIDTLLLRVEPDVARSLEAASLSPDWPLSPAVMRALEIRPDFMERALAAGLPLIWQPSDRYQPLPLLLQVLEKRLNADPERLAQLSAAYASVDEVDSGRQLEALLTMSKSMAQARLAEIVERQRTEDLADWVSAHAGVLWLLYRAGLLTREADVGVYLARARGEATSMVDAYAMLQDPDVRQAGAVMVEQVKAHLLQYQGRYVPALDALRRAVRTMEALPGDTASGAVYARTAVLETWMAAMGYEEADLSSAEQHARKALAAAPEAGLVRSMAVSVLARIRTLRKDGSPGDASVLELSLAQQATPDVLLTARLVADGLLDNEDPQGAVPLLRLIERGSPQGSATYQVELPLLLAKQALMSREPLMATAFARNAWGALNRGFRGDQGLLQHAAETRLLSELYARAQMKTSERKRLPQGEMKALITAYAQVNTLGSGSGARGATMDAILAWVALQDGMTRGQYGKLKKLLPELLEARSSMYIPALVLLLEADKIALPSAIRSLQEARTQFGRTAVKSCLAMLSPGTVVPEAPRLDVQLFGAPSVMLDGRPVVLSGRSLLLLAIMVTQGAVSFESLGMRYPEDFASGPDRYKAIDRLQQAFEEATQGESPLKLMHQKQQKWGLQAFELHSDYLDVPHMTDLKRQLLLRRGFMAGEDAEYVRRMRGVLRSNS
ncbi:hypothetical protein Q0M94_24910 (plasmid) [Deinococcus radiomollis]|uniref:hypothetical protein n=1 Tax=Deinococcus radiomollis TaxID=468916 RepID=UPI0038916A67